MKGRKRSKGATADGPPPSPARQNAGERAPARLLSAPWLVPITTPPLRDAALLLAPDDTILALAPRADLRREHPALSEERADGLLFPGLVNAHVHLELSALRGLVPGGTGLVEWAFAVMRTRAEVAGPALEDAAVIAARTAVAAGTAAVGEVANSLITVPALAAAGLRGLVFHELLGSRETVTGDALADAEKERQAFLQDDPWPKGVGYVPAPHAPYSANPELLRRIFAAAAGTPHPTSMHVAEDPDELALLADGSGKWGAILERIGVPAGARTPGLRPLAYLERLGAFAGPRPPLLVHMVHADATDLAIAASHRAPVVLCPRSNLHIGGRLADAPALLAAGLGLALGTDSLASTPTLSLWAEIELLARHFPEVPAATWLAAATIGGARALGLGEMGALAPGLRPGIVELTLDTPPSDGAALEAALVRNPDPVLRWRARA